MKITKTDIREKKALHQAFIRFLPIPIALVLLFSILISHSEFNQKKQAILHEQRTRIITAMIDYRDYISTMTSIVRTIEADYIDLSGNGHTDDALKALFVDNMKQYPIIDKLRILDLNGMEVLRVNQTADGPYVVPADELQDKSDRYYYQESIQLDRHQFLFSGLDLNMENGIVETDPDTGKIKPMLRVSAPLESDRQRTGYLVVNFLMREYLDAFRTSLDRSGCYILMLDENGYLYNDADDANNFGFCYGPESAQYNRTIYSNFPDIDPAAGSGSFIQDGKFCSYESYTHIYDRAEDYLLAETAPKQIILLACYDEHSDYASDAYYSYFYHLSASWKAQLIVLAIVFALYLLILRLIFSYDRIRFTNLFSDNRYSKSTIKQAFSRGQFVNYYQPIINIQDGTVLGVEALSRWKYRGQVLPPSMFIDEVLHYQLGQTLDETVFQTVRKDKKKMERHFDIENKFISINCCQQTFDSLIKDPPDTIIRLTEEEKKYIVLELVENIIFNQRTQDRIKELYKHNILFAIDDFGTGYSNVAFIRSFENLKVKIDRTFVPVDTTDNKERVIIEAFVKMFIDQGLKLIVEGVETREQCEYLKKLGVAGVQGYYFSHPMAIDQLIAFMNEHVYLRKLNIPDAKS